VIEPMRDHPQYEFFTQRKLDIKGSAVDKEIVERFWIVKEDEDLANPIGEGKTNSIAYGETNQFSNNHFLKCDLSFLLLNVRQRNSSSDLQFTLTKLVL
jgi:hypothetical protein